MSDKVIHTVPHDDSFLINFGSKHLRPIRISLPDPPDHQKIYGYGKPREEQYFKRIKFPPKIIALEEECYEYFKEHPNNYDIQQKFWELLELRKKILSKEISWMKKFRWHMHYGFWFFNNGKPTYITGWHFSYLHLHYMTLRKGQGYPEYDDRQRIRFLFRDYIWKTTETFRDLDPEGKAIKVDGKYHMIDIGIRTFFGTIEPKGRREGLTNEFSHIITRILSETYGDDNLGTTVSMDGDNAQTHFKKKLVPAFKKWPIWLKPYWSGGVTSIEFKPNKKVLSSTAKFLGSSIDYTESGSDLANDGKKIMAAGFDEQGKGKRLGNVKNRWQINKETMALEAGADILGFCIHPSTVEKMDEGGQDYKEMCDLSDFYQRGPGGQTMSGLSISYMPSSYCLRGFTDRFGLPVLFKPTEEQKRLGYNKDVGSRKWLMTRRNMMYDEKDANKMDEYRSFVRKFPEDYDDCWKGVSGYIGFPIEFMEKRKIALDNDPFETVGRLDWLNNRMFSTVVFTEDPEGPWTIHKIMQPAESGMMTTMEYYSAFEQDTVEMYRPLNPRCIVGVDPHEFSNESEAKRLGKGSSKLSSTGITVVPLRDPIIDKDELDPSTWKSIKVWATLEKRYNNNKDVAEEALKAAIYWNGLIHLERNKTEVWSKLVEWYFGGYLNHMGEQLPSGKIQIEQKPGTFMSTATKKKGFSLANDYFKNYSEQECSRVILEQGIKISSMEELTKYDAFASFINALIGRTSIYADYMQLMDQESEMDFINVTGRAV